MNGVSKMSISEERQKETQKLKQMIEEKRGYEEIKLQSEKVDELLTKEMTEE